MLGVMAVRTRRTVSRSSIPAVARARLVLLVLRTAMRSLLLLAGPDDSCRDAEADRHDQAVQQIISRCTRRFPWSATMVIPLLQFLNEVIDVPGMQVVQVLPSRCPLCATTGALHSCSRSSSPLSCKNIPHDQAVQRTIEIPLLPYLWCLMSLFTGRAFFLSWCRGGSPWSCCCIPVARGQGGRRPCLQVVRVPQVPSW